MALDQEHWPNDLEAFWLPFTANRQFKTAPRMFVSAKGMHYRTPDGREVLDGSAGLWCCNAGHGRTRIVEAIQKQVGELDYGPGFQVSHPKAFHLANKIIDIAPDGLDHVFFTNSGSESVETALKIAIAYHRARGEGQRVRLVGRERGYHGVNFGGISVGGIVNNRKVFGSLLNGVDHLRHTHLPELNSFTRGQPQHGAELADDLERLAALHGGETIAAVIIEPMLQAAGGMLVWKPEMLRMLRELCDRHGLLLIADEVMTGFGRTGKMFACEHGPIEPDLMCLSKGLTAGYLPLSLTVASDAVYDAFLSDDRSKTFFHGHSFTANPLGCAVALAGLDIFDNDGVLERIGRIEAKMRGRLQALVGREHTKDARQIGGVGILELDTGGDGYLADIGPRMAAMFLERNLLLRPYGNIIYFMPPYVVTDDEIDWVFDQIEEVASDEMRAAG